MTPAARILCSLSSRFSCTGSKPLALVHCGSHMGTASANLLTTPVLGVRGPALGSWVFSCPGSFFARTPFPPPVQA
eukprot:6491036-Amphidinium_carterae.4